MPKEGLRWMPKPELLTYEELAYLVHHFVELGINRVRITGGEPTLRQDLTKLIASLNHISGLDEISLTTNATRLSTLARPLFDAGLSRINISIDAADATRFADLTLSDPDRFELVNKGIKAAAELFPVVKLNAVILKDENEDQLLPLVEYASAINAQHHAQTHLRFIEYMPFQQRKYESIPSNILLERLRHHQVVQPIASDPNGGPAENYYLPKHRLVVGFITPLSARFCASCNRLRLTADGELRTCLAHQPNASLRHLIRGPHTSKVLLNRISDIVLRKQAQHNCETSGGELFQGIMTSIGG